MYLMERGHHLKTLITSISSSSSSSKMKCFFFFSWWDSIWHLLLGLSDIYYSQAQCRAINLVSNIGDYLVHNINTMQYGGADLIYKSKLFLFLSVFTIWSNFAKYCRWSNYKTFSLETMFAKFLHSCMLHINFLVNLPYFLINSVAILSCPTAYLQLISRKTHRITK